MTVIGYARVSTTDQNLELQENRAALRKNVEGALRFKR